MRTSRADLDPVQQIRTHARERWHLSTRRTLMRTLVPLLVISMLVTSSCQGASKEARPMKIGIIGTGQIGGTLAKLWVAAGHEVLLSSRHPDELRALAKQLGPKARVGTPREAASFGDVVLVSVPYKALPELGRDLKTELAGKIVLDTCNPYPERDGEMASDARSKGTGVASPELLPGARLVRAFNAIYAESLAGEAHRKLPLVGIPLAGDDAEALRVAQRLVSDAGFDPVVVGGLARAKDFDVGTAVYTKLLTAAELRTALGPSTP
jgi:8-hydroxy-5-deazaflavin:NADPH oxidoreductase